MGELRRVEVFAYNRRWRGWFHGWFSTAEETFAVVENEAGVCLEVSIQKITFLRPPQFDDAPYALSPEKSEGRRYIRVIRRWSKFGFELFWGLTLIWWILWSIEVIHKQYRAEKLRDERAIQVPK